ncbi:MAG: OmpH family outer membrane protein [Novosphingobium sp.]
MTKFTKLLCGGALALAIASPVFAQKKPATASAPAPAATPAPAIVPGLGIANLEAAVVNSNAYRAAAQQRQTYYKQYYESAEAKAKQVDAQLKVAVDKFNADKAAKKPDAVLQQDLLAIRQIEERGKEEIRQILMPVMLSEAYVEEQITDKLDQAVQGAMAKRGVTILLQPGTVIARANSYEMTGAIIAELNVLIPTANLVPPQGWVPRAVREQQAAQQGGQQPQQPQQATPPAASAPAPRPAGPQPDGR